MSVRFGRFNPRALGHALRALLWFLEDALDVVLQRRDPLVPPRRFMFDGVRDHKVFKANGEEFFRYYTELCNLQGSERMLDIGSGVGRKTIPLVRYLNETGGYEGFDVVRVHVDWCKKKIQANYPNFRFQHIDIFNRHYNPRGIYAAEGFKFPYDDQSFDFVVATSVFTHMLPGAMENYIKEMSRVLRMGGRCLITFFLINDESLKLVQLGKSSLDFRHQLLGYATVSKSDPEAAIAYDETYIIKLYNDHGLNVLEPIHYGSWCGRDSFLSYQDIIIAQRPQ